MKLDSLHPVILKPKSLSVVKIQQCWVEEGVVDGSGCGGRCPRASKAEPATGIVVAGVAVATSCQLVLPIFGALFLIVGTVLTVASYRGPEMGEDMDSYLERVSLTSNLRVLGPVCLLAGGLMLLLGLLLVFLSRRGAGHPRAPYHCPIHGHFYPISPAPNSNNKILSKRSSIVASWCGASENPGTPQCPHSTRSSVSHHASSPFPAPSIALNLRRSLMPVPLTAGGDSSSSMRSLSVGYDVASFPHTRSPSPPTEMEDEDEDDAQPANPRPSPLNPVKLSSLD